MSGQRFFAVVLAVGLAAPTGCGGNVVVDGPGGGGGGGGGGSPTGGSTTGGTTTTSTVFSPPSYCSFMCTQAELHGCLGGGGVGDCQESCVLVFAEFPSCQAELKVYFDCAVKGYAVDCNASGNACDDEIEGLLECVEEEQ